jgi:hypothetical protein
VCVCACVRACMRVHVCVCVGVQSGTWWVSESVNLLKAEGYL